MEGSTGYWAGEEDTGQEGFVQDFEDIFWLHDEAADVWVARHFKGGRRLAKMIQERDTKRHKRRKQKERVSVPFMRCSIKVREKPKASLKDNKARTKTSFPPIGQKEKENIN